MARIPVYTIAVPDYTVRQKPNHKKIGARIDQIFKKNFTGQRIIVRCLSSQEHDTTRSELIQIIRKIGTDRYDPHRNGDRYENVENKHIDFFALEFRVSLKSRIMEKFIEPFYSWPISVKEKPTRIDLALVYDPRLLKRVAHTYSDGRKKNDGYIFRDPQRKKDALLAIILIK